jgi:hypothetical protein
MNQNDHLIILMLVNPSQLKKKQKTFKTHLG